MLSVQHYADFIADVPTIGVLFVLKGSGAGLVALLLTTRRAVLGALGGVVLRRRPHLGLDLDDRCRLVCLHRADVSHGGCRRDHVGGCCDRAAARVAHRAALLGASASISPRPDPAPPLTARERQRAVN